MSRPAFEQPVLAQANGKRWWLQVTNQGALDTARLTDADLTPIRRLKMIDTNETTAYTLTLSNDAVPVLVVTPLASVALGNHKDLPIWSPNGREWTLQIVNGVVTLTPLSIAWPTMVPIGGMPSHRPGLPYQFPDIAIVDDKNILWRILVTDGGLWEIQNEQDLPIKHLSHCALWTQGDEQPFQITVNTEGLLTVTDAPLTTPKLYEIVLISPSGLFYVLQGQDVAGDVILEVSNSIQDAMDNRDEWPLMIAQNGRYIYISDDRFPPPIPSMPRRWGQRRRSARPSR